MNYPPKTANIDLKKIIEFTKSPNWLTESTFGFPIVSKLGKEFFCIENWEMVRAMQSHGLKRMKCLVVNPIFSWDFTIASLKMMLRYRGISGSTTYPEFIKHLRWIHLNLGVQRMAESFDDKDKWQKFFEEIRPASIAMLALGSGLDVNTIEMSLAHASNLEDDFLDELAMCSNSMITEDFFKVIQSEKLRKIENLKINGKNDEQISAEISSWIRSLL